MRVSLDREVFEGDLDVFADKPELQGYQLHPNLEFGFPDC